MKDDVSFLSCGSVNRLLNLNVKCFKMVYVNFFFMCLSPPPSSAS